MMGELYGSQYAKDLLWQDPELRFAHHLTQLSAKKDLRDKVEARSNIVINKFSELQVVLPAYYPFTFFYKQFCYIDIEGGESILETLDTNSFPKHLDFESTIFLRSIWVDPVYRNSGLATSAMNQILAICEAEKYALLCTPRSFEISTGRDSIAERLEVIKANPSWRLIGTEISDEDLDLVYGFYEKLGFEEMPPDKSFKVPRGIMVKSFQ